MFACAYKREVAGPNKIQNGWKIQTKRNFLHYKPAYNGHNALAKRVYEYILGVADEYNP